MLPRYPGKHGTHERGTLVRTTYIHVLHGRQLRRVHVRPSVTEPGTEGYCTIYPLKFFRWYSQATKNLLHEKKNTRNILQHGNFPIYGIAHLQGPSVQYTNLLHAGNPLNHPRSMQQVYLLPFLNTNT